MILQDKFYSFREISEDRASGTFSYEIIFNAAHEIFDGHFVDQPVVPGVTIIQLVKELFTSAYGGSYSIKQIVNCKFLQVIDPRERNIFVMNISVTQADGLFVIDAQMGRASNVAFKMRAKLEKVNG